MKKNAPIENFYDREYRFLHNEMFQDVSALCDAVKTYRIKEIKTRLFPKNTDSYIGAVQELEDVKNKIWLCKLHYAAAVAKAQEYYARNHHHFVACKDYLDPHEIDVETVIDNCIEDAF